MKKISILISLFVLSSWVFGQKKEAKVVVPQEVQAAFQKLYPAAKEVEWELEDNEYEAEFEIKEVEQSALFDAKGVLLESEIEIQIKELPSAVLASMKANYPKQKIKEASKITNANGTETYEVEVKGKDILFNADGKVVEKEKG